MLFRGIDKEFNSHIGYHCKQDTVEYIQTLSGDIVEVETVAPSVGIQDNNSVDVFVGDILFDDKECNLYIVYFNQKDLQYSTLSYRLEDNGLRFIYYKTNLRLALKNGVVVGHVYSIQDIIDKLPDEIKNNKNL